MASVRDHRAQNTQIESILEQLLSGPYTASHDVRKLADLAFLLSQEKNLPLTGERVWDADVSELLTTPLWICMANALKDHRKAADVPTCVILPAWNTGGSTPSRRFAWLTLGSHDHQISRATVAMPNRGAGKGSVQALRTRDPVGACPSLWSYNDPAFRRIRHPGLGQSLGLCPGHACANAGTDRAARPACVSTPALTFPSCRWTILGQCLNAQL